MSVILFIIVLAVLILAHEFGHFIVAKKSGIRVDEFGLGFPPKIWSFKKGETVYSLNLIPFGGFVKIYGENPDEESISGDDSDRSLVNKPKYIQAAVMVAGVSFNILLAWLLLTLGFVIGLPSAVSGAPSGSTITDPQLTIVHVLPSSPAEEAGIMGGDEIISLASGEDTIIPKTDEDVSKFISNSSSDVTFIVNRSDEKMTFTTTPESGIVEDGVAVGISMEQIGIVSLPIHLAFIHGAVRTWDITTTMVGLFAGLISDALSGENVSSAVVGPVGIVGLVGDAASLGFVYLLTFTALISINLAIVNLIPFPALDGGRLLFILIEAIKGSPIKPKIANTLNIIGFLLLISLMLVITFFDIIRLF